MVILQRKGAARATEIELITETIDLRRQSSLREKKLYLWFVGLTTFHSSLCSFL